MIHSSVVWSGVFKHGYRGEIFRLVWQLFHHVDPMPLCIRLWFSQKTTANIWLHLLHKESVWMPLAACIHPYRRQNRVKAQTSKTILTETVGGLSPTVTKNRIRSEIQLGVITVCSEWYIAKDFLHVPTWEQMEKVNVAYKCGCHRRWITARFGTGLPLQE